MRLMGYEDFIEVDDIQFYKEVRIEIDYPYSEVIFDQKDFEDATEVTIIKFLGGFNESEQRTIYLNDIELKNEDLFFWEDGKKNIFIEKYNNKIKKENRFIVEIKNKDQFEYIRHIMIIDKKDFYNNNF